MGTMFVLDQQSVQLEELKTYHMLTDCVILIYHPSDIDALEMI